MGIARGEHAVRDREAWVVLNGQEQVGRRFVELTLEEIGVTDCAEGRALPLARTQAQRGFDMLDCGIGFARPHP
jgi:hypothetical protein